MIDEDVSALVLCATEDEHAELSVLLDMVTRRSVEQKVCDRVYTIREIAHDGHAATVCTSCVGEIGRLPAAIAARDIIYHFYRTPRDVILCGIAAAHPDSDYRLGDIVIPAQIVDYAEQKHSKGRVKFRARDYPLDDNRLFKLARDLLKMPWHERIEESVRHSILRNIRNLRWPPVCHTNLSLACGDYVLDDETTVKEILKELSSNRKYIVNAVEMESTAIARSLQSVLSEDAQLTVVKSISDFAFRKTDSAQPGAQLIAAAFVRELLLALASQKTQKKPGQFERIISRDVIASLRPNPAITHMLNRYPPELAAGWRETAIDGAIEIFACSRPPNKYGGYQRRQILCEIENVEWPSDYGGLDSHQKQGMELGIAGSKDGSVEGWLKTARGTPNRIRTLLEPPLPTVLDRGTLGLKFGNSDYFTVRTITELARRNFQGLKPDFDTMFPNRWSSPEHRFDAKCVPYHVSAQAVLVARPEETPNSRYLLLASINPADASITPGWGATMAEQMWAPSERRHGEPWWEGVLRSRTLAFRPPESRSGDLHINDTLARGLCEEFQIDVDGADCYQEPLLLCVAIEQDMYFVTFIYFVELRLSLGEVYERWKTAPDNQEMGVLAAYQLTGTDSEGMVLDGPRRLAELMALDEFDPGPYLLPNPIDDKPLRAKWHVSSRLRMYACGMHLWHRQFAQFIHIEI